MSIGIVCWGKPPTANKPPSPAGRRFLAATRDGYLAVAGPLQAGLLYGRVFWFVRDYDPGIHPDADNLSKKIWDAGGLPGLAYADDKQVRLRVAAVIDVGSAGTGSVLATLGLDLAAVPGMLVDALERLLDAPPARQDVLAGSFTYIECGPLGPGMLGFAAEGPGIGRGSAP